MHPLAWSIFTRGTVFFCDLTSSLVCCKLEQGCKKDTHVLWLIYEISNLIKCRNFAGINSDLIKTVKEKLRELLNGTTRSVRFHFGSSAIQWTHLMRNAHIYKLKSRPQRMHRTLNSCRGKSVGGNADEQKSPRWRKLFVLNIAGVRVFLGN